MDLALGHLQALDYAQAHTGFQAINLGAGKGYSVLEVVTAFQKASGTTIPYKISPRRTGDIATCYADPSKAHRLLGFSTKRGLGEMCADSWNFTQKNPKGL